MRTKRANTKNNFIYQVGLQLQCIGNDKRGRMIRANGEKNGWASAGQLLAGWEKEQLDGFAN